MSKLRVLDLFSGIGGFSLGLERTGGFETVAFCEIEDYPRRVLARHWPEVPIYDDVRTLTAERLAADGITVDVICGGFPCQDLSIAGDKAGLDGERSGLWSEYARLIGELRPKYALVENVANLLAGPSEQPGGWFGRVLGDVAALRYNAEWHGIPASHVGAEHDRDRVWIIAYLDQVRKLQPQGSQQDERRRAGNRAPAPSPHAHQARRAGGLQTGADLAHVARFQPWLRSALNHAPAVSREHWNHQPVLGGRVHGVPFELDVARGLGNAEVGNTEAKSASRKSVWLLLRAVWEHRESAKASPELYVKRLCGAVPGLPYENTHGRWLLGPWIDADKELRGLWSDFYAKPYEEAQDLQQRVLERIGKKKCPEAVERGARIGALGNAVYPLIPEMIGRAILSAEGALAQ